MEEGKTESLTKKEDTVALKKEQEKTKHALDWALGVLALVSVCLNIVQFRWTVSDRKTAVPGPLIYRIAMPAADGGLFANLSEHKDVVFTQFPNPRILKTHQYENAKVNLYNLTPIELRNRTWNFFVMRNVSDKAYSSVTLSNAKMRHEIGQIEPGSTCLVYYESEKTWASALAKYKVHGADKEFSLSIPSFPSSESEIPFLTVMSGITRIGALQGFDKSDRLYQFRQSDHYEIPSGGSMP